MTLELCVTEEFTWLSSTPDSLIGKLLPIATLCMFVPTGVYGKSWVVLAPVKMPAVLEAASSGS